MDGDIEHLVLSGKLFGTNSGSSPERTPSPTFSFTSTDSLGDEKPTLDVDAPYESIGMGPGRTGVKGVLRDQHEAQAIQAAKREREIEVLRRRMARGNLGGKTFLEEEREKQALEEWEEGEREREHGNCGRAPKGRTGSFQRRARAAALGFASKGSPRKRYAPPSRQTMPGRFMDDEDDPYADDKDEKTPYYDEDEYEEENVDTDMLPTLLVYRDGELVHNWVRVDWEAGKAGIEELLSRSLRRHVIGEASTSGNDNCGLPSDGEDLIWSDEESPEL
ncbi:hypothetical protein JVT61DRAFT_9253 [Boletus reticuloceps]|uniref:Phosducin thioredoxin-like domain-containing protein n=1 Tax=Boletus reticuloceps TaxID=495285 RepID=A0A8I2YGY9_9AGAM|nr:hypothetical protein JVT61DRAFT_9253 [Boletus reticuloceps]